ncbi:hypothetical protein PJP07_30820, partial [Mycobacterium kansasii]
HFPMLPQCFPAFLVVREIIGNMDIVSISLTKETCRNTDTWNTSLKKLGCGGTRKETAEDKSHSC